jgi:anti-sigma-K factor RskA
MNWKRNPALQDRLAAEYALGTLRGAARLRFARWMQEDAALRGRVAEWESRLGPLATAIEPKAPPARVWTAISARLGRPSPALEPGSLWERVAFWRGLGLLASGMAVALMVASVVVQPQQLPAPAPVLVQVPSGELGAAYLAVLSDPKTQKPVLLVSAGRKSSDLFVKTLDPAIHVDQKSLELWALPAGGAPKSLGVLGADDKMKLRLQAVADESLSNVPALAVSLEPKGGSPTGAPTGPVLFSGPCVRHW